MIPRTQPMSSTRQTGFTLVELMIASTISLIVLLVMTTLLVNTTRTNAELARVNSQIENGRFSIQLLENDLSMAGFWASHIPTYDDLTFTGTPIDVPAAVPAPCQAYDPATWTAAYKTDVLGIPLQVYESAPAGCEAVVTNQRANTDVLLVRHANNCVPGDANCEADIAGKLYFQASSCETEISGGQRYALDTANFTLTQRDCATAASKRKFISHLYYIRDYANTAGDSIPTLVRSQYDLAGGTVTHLAADPLIEGIEGFKVELGIDNLSDTGAAVNFTQAVTWADPNTRDSPTNRGDGTPDEFIRCTTAAPCTQDDLMNTVAARIHLLVRSREATPGYTDTKTYDLAGTTLGPFNDGFQRHVFSTSVRLVNISSRRETP